MTTYELIKSLQIIFACIMSFSFGMSHDVTDKSRKVAKVVWIVSLVILWILNM